MWFAARVVRRRGLGGVGRREPRDRACRSTSIARRTLGRNASIAVVRVGDQRDGRRRHRSQVTKLGDAELDEHRSRRTRRANGRRPRGAGRPDSVMEDDARPDCGTAPPGAERHRAGRATVTDSESRARGSPRGSLPSHRRRRRARARLVGVRRVAGRGRSGRRCADSPSIAPITAPPITGRRRSRRRRSDRTRRRRRPPSTDAATRATRAAAPPATPGRSRSTSATSPGTATARTRTASRTRASSSSCCSRCSRSRPRCMVMLTSFTRIVIVLSLTRNALGLTVDPAEPGRDRARDVPQPVRDGADAVEDQRRRAAAVAEGQDRLTARRTTRRRSRCATFMLEPDAPERAEPVHRRERREAAASRDKVQMTTLDPRVRALGAEDRVHHRVRDLHPVPDHRPHRELDPDVDGHVHASTGSRVAAVQAAAVRDGRRVGAHRPLAHHELPPLTDIATLRPAKELSRDRSRSHQHRGAVDPARDQARGADPRRRRSAIGLVRSA